MGSDTVTATYSGDGSFAPQTTTTTLTITKATPTFVEAASPASIVDGSQDTLSDPVCQRGHRHGDLLLRRIDALHRDFSGDKLPDVDHPRGRDVPGDRDVLG